MMLKKTIPSLLAMLMLASSAAMPVDALAQKKQTATAKKSGTPAKKQAAKASTSSIKSTKKKTSAKPAAKKQPTAAEVKKQEEAARRDIKKTQAEIAANEKSISQGVSNLQRLEGDIKVSRQEVKNISSQVAALHDYISDLEKNIAREEQTLDRLRAGYLHAVKKMRIARKKNSKLAFIFSSKSISEAMRRMRYLKDFSKWKEKQTRDINASILRLRREHEELVHSRADRDAALQRQVAAQNTLERQHSEQDAIVAQLRRNGEALNAHLAKKQAEANQLRNTVSNLIAQEEARRQEAEKKKAAEAETRRRDEARRQEEARLKKEQEAKVAAEKAATEKAIAEKAAKEKAAKDKSLAANNTTPKKETKKDTKSQSAPASQKKADGKTYADARKRQPRNEDSKTPEAKPSTAPAPKPSSAPATKPASSANSNSGFESMKGQLPRPVSGGFKVISQFGRHQVPGLEGVFQDNPGIDAEVAKGASAQAVYAGDVSGVYMLDGYSTVVIVNHGGYYTVYGNISSPSVKPGDKVKQGQTVGKVAANPDNNSHGMIHFEVWKKRDRQNPMSWIR